jgi:hypothetical protein
VRQREIVPAPTVLITSADPYRLHAMLKREKDRRAIIVRPGHPVEIQPGLWGAEVIQLKPYRPAWVLPAAAVTAVTAGLAALGVLGWLLVSAAGVSALGALAALVGVVWLLTRGRGGGRCEVDVHIRHRHR